MRYATVQNSTLETVRAYLPVNYHAFPDPVGILIVGRDVAGWTLDGYIIPRLASGLIVATEVPDAGGNRLADAWKAVESARYDVVEAGNALEEICLCDDPSLEVLRAVQTAHDTLETALELIEKSACRHEVTS